MVPTSISLMVLATLLQAQGTEPDLSMILGHARERVEHFYRELQRVAWVDTVREQALKDNRDPKEKPKEVVYDMLVRLEMPKDEDGFAPFYIREVSQLIRIDGKAVSAKDSSSSTNTNHAILSVLHPLLARGDFIEHFHFVYSERVRLNGRPAHVIRFNRDDAQHYSGRIWIDAETYDSLKIEWKVSLPDNQAKFVRIY